MSTTTKSELKPGKVKKLMWTLGSCSQTYFHVINRDFGHENKLEEKASDPFAGGVMRKGFQCGMLWGSALAIGAEADRRFENKEQAKAITMSATVNIVDSFTRNTETLNCREITGTNWDNPFQIMRYMLFRSGKCMKLAENFVHEAIKIAKESLASDQGLDVKERNCASEVVKEMGGNESEQVMVAGFAGGLGLSGEACGALAAAIWYDSLRELKKNPKSSMYNNPNARKLIRCFEKVTGGEFKCSEICKCKFKESKEHSEYLEKGGCQELIEALSSKEALN